MPLIGYYANDDATGLDNLCFDATDMPNLAEMLLNYVDKDTLAEIIKQAIQSQSDSEIVSSVMGSIIDNLVDSDAIISLLDDAKINAFKLEIYDPESSSLLNRTTEYFNGYELRSIAKSYDVTDRVITDIKAGSLPYMGYGTKNTDTDATRTYGIAYTQDADGNVAIYNFNNSGMAIRSALVKDDESGSKSFETTLSPVTGTIDLAQGVFTLDDHQQLSCTPSYSSSLLGGNLNSMSTTLLWPVETSNIASSQVHPAWSSSKQVESTVSVGYLSHSGNRWAKDCGGTLSTTATTATISIGDYAPVSANISAATGLTTPLYTTNGPIVYDTTWTISGVDTEYDCTADVNLDMIGLDVEANPFDTESGIWGKGRINCTANSDNVEKYDALYRSGRC